MRSVLAGLVLLSACGTAASLPPLDGPADAGVGPAPDGAVVADAGSVTITFTSQSTSGQAVNTSLVAYQDGDGPWQVVAGEAGVYRFPVSGERYGLLAACGTSNGTSFVRVGFFAVSDGTERFGLDTCVADASPTVPISGTTSHASGTELIQITSGLSRTFAAPGQSWTGVALPGPGTLVGVKRGLEDLRASSAVLLPVTYAQGATFDIDFTDTFDLAENLLTLDVAGTGSLLMETRYIDGTGGEHDIDEAQTADPSTTFRVVPADRLGDGISLLEATFRTTATTRVTTRAFRDPVAQVVAPPPELQLSRPPTISTSVPYVIADATMTRRAGSSYYALSYFNSPGDGTTHIWDLMYSAAWVDGVPGADLSIVTPDFSALPGWRASFGLAAAGFRIWVATIATGPGRLMPGASRYAPFGRATASYLDGDEITKTQAFGELR